MSVTNMVRDMIPFMRARMSGEEMDLAIYLRGNEPLYNSLVSVIRAKIEGRARLPEPSDPLECKSRMARDHELRWLLNRLEFIHRAPVLQPVDSRDEQPA